MNIIVRVTYLVFVNSDIDIDCWTTRGETWIVCGAKTERIAIESVKREMDKTGLNYQDLKYNAKEIERTYRIE